MYPTLGELSEIIINTAREQLLPRFAAVEGQWKADRSLLTEADLAVQNQIGEALTLRWPTFGFLSEEMEEEAQWIAAINPSIPLHVTRFFPRYHMQQTKATLVETVYSLAGTAKKYLKHVFVGNC